MSLELIVVTPEGQAYAGSVDQVVLPGSEGDFGVLEQHERYLAPLRCGTMEIQTGDSSTWAAVADGFADVSSEQVVVLVGSCRTLENIDAEAARADQQEAQHALDQLTLSDADQARRSELENARDLATAQLDVHSKG